MSLYQAIRNKFPEITDEDFAQEKIVLQDDSDGRGAYIRKWDVSSKLTATILKELGTELREPISE